MNESDFFFFGKRSNLMEQLKSLSMDSDFCVKSVFYLWVNSGINFSIFFSLVKWSQLHVKSKEVALGIKQLIMGISLNKCY